MQPPEARSRSPDALRRAESKLRALSEESQDMILSTDEQGTILEVNQAGLLLLGYQEAGQLLGRGERELWSNPADHEVFRKLLREGGRVKDFEVILVRRDGRPIFGLANATVIPATASDPMEVHATVKDITERVNDAQAMWKLNLDLADANQRLKDSHARTVQQEKLASIGQLAAGIAHEINNPLGFLKSNFAALSRYIRQVERFLGDAGIDPAAARASFGIDRILESLDLVVRDCDDGFRRIAEIVQTLRNFARIDPEGAHAPFDLNAGVQAALTVAASEVKYVAAVTLALEPLPPVDCAEGEITQVFLNLIVNAAQAIKDQHRPDKGKIEIRSGTRPGLAWVEIEDDGPGIPGELRSRIFEPFYTTKPKGQGTGLGLSISHDIVVNRHGGALSVREAPGHGACFRIELPLGPAPAPEKSASDAGTAPPVQG